MRACDGCTSCCYNTKVPELNKVERIECVHCTGTDCSIYDTRPKSCRAFECAWLQGMFSEEHRPDKCGVMIENYKEFLFVMCEDTEWKNMIEEFNACAKRGIPVVVGTTKTNTMILPVGVQPPAVFEMIRKAMHGSC